MSNKSYLFGSYPKWRRLHSQNKSEFSQEVATWIFEKGSLTQRLRKRYGKGLQVRVLRENWTRPSIDECRRLNITPRSFCLIREVVLQAEGKTLILARSIIPENTIKFAAKKLKNLGTRPLGEIIFAFRDLGRESLEIVELSPEDWTEQATKEFRIENKIRGRRTCYAISKQRLLVSEFFMPELTNGNRTFSVDKATP